MLHVEISFNTNFSAFGAIDVNCHCILSSMDDKNQNSCSHGNAKKFCEKSLHKTEKAMGGFNTIYL